jgi:hypothetical protein
MEGYGWTPGLHHALVVLSVDAKARTLKVADPSYGQETWPGEGTGLDLGWASAVSRSVGIPEACSEMRQSGPSPWG